MALLLSGGRKKSHGKTSRVVKRKRSGGRMMGSSTGGSRAVARLKTSAPSTRAPVQRTNTSNRNATQVIAGNLTEEQKKRLRKSNPAMALKLGLTAAQKRQAVRTPAAPTPVAKSGPSAQSKAGFSGSFMGSTSNLLMGKQTPKLEFSVLPGAQQGPSMFGQSFDSNNTSTLPYARNETEAKKLASDQRKGEIGMAVAGLALPGPKLGLGKLASKLAPKLTEKISSGAKSLYGKVAGVFGGKQTATAIKALETQAAKGNAAAQRTLAKLKSGAGSVTKNVAPSTIKKQFKSNPVRSTMSTLGGAIIGGSVAAIAINSAQEAAGTGVQPGVVRNATPPLSAGGADIPGVSPARTGGSPNRNTNDVQPVGPETDQAPNQSAVQQGTPSTISQQTRSGRSQHLSSSSTGQRASGAVVSAPGSDDVSPAQAKAIELQRSQAPVGVGATPVGDTVSLEQMAATRDETRALIDKFGTAAMSMPEYKQNVQTLLAGNMADLNRMHPPVPEPVVETPAQADWLSQFEDPMEQFDMQQYSDQLRREYGLPGLEAQKQQIQNLMDATTQTYQPLIDQIKKNPNLPKGLAARRLTEVFEDQKFAMDALIADMRQKEDLIEESNKALDRQLGIAEFNYNKAERERDRRIDEFGMMVDSGAIGGMDERSINQWAATTGIPISAVRQMKQNALTPDRDYATSFQTDNNGNVSMITYDKNDPFNVQTQSLGSLGKAKAAPAAPKVNTMTLSEIQKNNLPSSFLGRPEAEAAQFLDEVGQSTPPEWWLNERMSGLQTDTAKQFFLNASEDVWDQYRGQYGPEQKGSLAASW